MESSGAQKLSLVIFCIRCLKRLTDSISGKKPLHLIFALPFVFSGIFHLLMLKGGLQPPSLYTNHLYAQRGFATPFPIIPRVANPLRAYVPAPSAYARFERM